MGVMTKIRKKYLISTSVFLLSAITPAMPASAQQAVKQPVSGWAVTRVDPQGGAASYCALARKYAPDTALTIARNGLQESSIAIDFQRAVFNTGRDISVTLNAGDGESRLFDTRPISRSAIVLRTGVDGEFFRALRGTRSLTATIDGDTHRFVMPDIEMGLSQLGNCLGDVPASTAIPMASATPVETPVALSGVMDTHQSARLAELQDRLERLENENRAVNNDRTSTNSTIQARLSRLEAEKLELSAQLEAERARYREEIASGNDELASQLSAMEAQLAAIEADKREQLASAQEEIERIESEKRDLLNANRVAMASAQDEIERIQSERDELVMKLEAERADYDSRIAKGQAANTQKIEDLQTALADLERRNETLLSENRARQEQLTNQLEELKVENQTLQTRLREERDQYQKQLVNSADEREKKLAELQTQLDEVMAQNRALEQSQTEETASLRAEQERITDLQARLEVVEAEKATLQTSMQQRIAELQSQKEALQQDQDTGRAELLAQLDALRARNADLARQLERDRAGYEQTLEQTGQRGDAQVQTLMDQLALAEKRNEALSEAMKANDAATQAVMETGAADQATLAALEAARMEQMELAAMLEAEKARRTRIEQILNARGAGNQQLELTQQLAQLQQENERLRANLDERGVATADSEQLRVLQNTIQAKDQRIASVERERESLMNELQAEREKFRTRLRDTAGQANDPMLDQAADRLTMLEARNESLMRALQEERSRTSSSGASPNISSLQAEKEELRVMLQAEQARRERLETVLNEGAQPGRASRPVPTEAVSALNARIAELEEKNQTLARALSQRQTGQLSTPIIEQVEAPVNADMAQALNSVTAERDRLRQQLAAIRDTSRETREAVEMRQRLREMEERNRQLASQLAQKPDQRPGVRAALPVPESRVGRDMLRSTDLAEVQNALEIALAERDEYQALLQNERQRMRDMQSLKTRKATIDGDEVALNDMIRRLEAEKVRLVRALEHERARADNGEPTSSPADQARIAQLEAERDALREALEGEQQALEEKREDLAEEKQQVETELAAAQQDVETIREEQRLYSRRLQQANMQGISDDTLVEKDDALEEMEAENQLLASELAMMDEQQTDLRVGDITVEPEQSQAPEMAAATPNTPIVNMPITNLNEKERLQRRFEEAERENIRLAQQLAAQKQQFEARLSALEQGGVAIAAPAPGMMPEAPAQERAVHERIEGGDNMDVVVASDAPKSALQRLRERIRLPGMERLTVPAETVVAEELIEEDIPVRVAAVEREAAITSQPLHIQRMELAPPASAMAPIIDTDDNTAMMAPAPEPVATVAQNAPVIGPDGAAIRRLLQQAGVRLQGGLQQVDQVTTADFSAFRWDTGAVFGSAEQSRIANPYLFDNFMEGYLSKTESRCSGVFDKSAGGVSFAGELPVATYDIACITNADSGEGAGAALLFFIQDGLFNVVAHEGGLGQFEEAMNTRDRLSGSLIR